MFFMREGQTLYFSTWEYNACLILEELACIVENNGGRVESNTSGYIVNRSIHEIIEKASLDIEKIKNAPATDDPEKLARRQAYIDDRQKAIDDLNKIGNEPRKVSHTGWIHFVYEGHYYSLCFNDNQFFEHYYIKTPLRDGGRKYSKDACGMPLSREYLWDCFMTVCNKPATDDDRREVANQIFNDLVNAQDCEIIRDGHKTRIPNRYDGRYHYEMIYNPERIGEINF